MRNIIVLIFVLMYMTSCTNKTKDSSGKDNGDSLVEMSILEHQKEDNIQYFIKDANGNIFITDGGYLRNLYENHYRQKINSFQSFISLLQNKNLSISFDIMENGHPYHYYEDKFIVCNNIMEAYKNNGTEYLLSVFMEKRNGFYYYKKNMSSQERKTIAYCCWLNGYKYVFGGTSGAEYIYK